MRVIAGTAKGRKLKLPEGLELRPSSDRLKEALFSTLAPRIPGGRVLDLYAGTGALGIEALSRGAVRAVFVEQDRKAAEVVRANLEVTGLSAGAEIVQLPVLDFARSYSGPVFGVVMADPPYEEGVPAEVLSLLAARGALDEESIVVVEASRRKMPFDPPPSFAINRHKVYGDSVLIYLSRLPERALR